MRQWPDLSELLAGLSWAVCGAVATRNYMPERGTQDLDVLVQERDLPEVEGRLRAHGAEFVSRLSIGGSTWRLPDGIRLDVIEGREPWTETALRLAADTLDQQGLPVLTLPYLVLMKMESDRLVDAGDIGRMLGMADDASRNEVRAVIRTHRPDFLEDLESMIHLGDLEFRAQ